MSIAKKSDTPPHGFILAYARKSGDREWVCFKANHPSPASLEGMAAIDAGIWVQYGNRDGRDVIYVRGR
ncbi:hypothetical protein HK17_13480 [Acetobacter indonesiensis]|uniref:Uncharacterized protein n=1 Tax=Acetobacter indonesiensis TaxID=104101 RepID=A0A252AM16_9PROT|nr:hypothetical protein HK17_13480 [Acetobacter indonesiensis]